MTSKELAAQLIALAEQLTKTDKQDEERLPKHQIEAELRIAASAIQNAIRRGFEGIVDFDAYSQAEIDDFWIGHEERLISGIGLGY